MNLIEISEQLKDVPDQFLMKEVQAPSGAYPAYLVVAELGRRKRMRDNAMKERPQTTVSQDLAQPEELRMAMAQMQQPQVMSGMPQMAPGMPQMSPQMAPQDQMMSQPDQRLNAGIMATPQATEELSAQDAMAAQRMMPRMAGGGLVAFNEGGKVKKFDDRGAVRFQNQGRVPTEAEVRKAYDEWMESQGPWYLPRPQADMSIRAAEDKYTQMLQAYQSGKPILPAAPAVSPAAPGTPAATTAVASTTPVPSTQMAQAQAASPTTLKDNLPTPPKVAMPTYKDPFQAQMQANLTAMQALKEPTEAEILASRARGAQEYERMVPDRATPLLQEAISKQQRDIEGRRGSNVNEALIQAGLGIMGSKSPRFLQAVGEGGTAALRDYRQGMKDIREGERDILKSRVDLANAQTLRDQNKFGAAEKAEKRGLEAYDRGMTRLNTESAIIKRNQDAAMASAKLPFELRETAARAKYYEEGGRGAGVGGKLSDADQKAAEEAARTRAMMTPGVKFGTPEYQTAFNRFYQEELARRAAGVNYVAPTAGAMPPGWSVSTR